MKQYVYDLYIKGDKVEEEKTWAYIRRVYELTNSALNHLQQKPNKKGLFIVSKGIKEPKEDYQENAYERVVRHLKMYGNTICHRKEFKEVTEGLDNNSIKYEAELSRDLTHYILRGEI